MAQLPVGAQPGRRTPTFTADSTPPALLKDHRTTVWAQLIVEGGSVIFTESDTGTQHTATAAEPITIVPNLVHFVKPSADAQFHVQFYEAEQADP